MSGKPFLDTNVVVYAFSVGDVRNAVAEKLVGAGGVVSVQVLNEFVNVSRRKRRRSWDDIRSELQLLYEAFETVPVLVETHRLSVSISSGHGLSIYDSLIVAAARLAGCPVLYTEDLQDGRRIEGVLIRNPFIVPAP